MDRDHNPRRGVGTKDLDHHLRPTLPKPLYYPSWTSWCRENPYYYVRTQIPRGVTRVPYRPDFYEDGVPCRCPSCSQADYYRFAGASYGVPLHELARRRVDRIHARLRRRVSRWAHHLLRRGGSI